MKEEERAQAKKAPKRGGSGGGKFRKSRQAYYQRDYRFEPYNEFGRRERFALPPPPMPSGSPDLACWGFVFVVMQ